LTISPLPWGTPKDFSLYALVKEPGVTFPLP